MNSLQWRTWPASWGRSGAGLAMMVAIVALLALPAHHPYYFGDELISFVSAADHGGWAGVYEVLNNYKPRLVYNAIWAWIAGSGLPRWVPMGIVVLSLAAAATLCRRIAVLNLGCPAAAGWLVAAVVVTSRFGTVAFFDYISGTIEMVSLALFLLNVSLVLDRMQRRTDPNALRTTLALLSAMALVFVHERYAAALVPVGAALCLQGWLAAPKRRDDLLLGLSIAVVPAIAFISATKWLSVMSLATGTAAESVRPSMDLVEAWWTYLANVFIGSNFGNSWLVGSLHWGDAQWGAALAAVSVGLALAWCVPLFIKPLRAQGRLLEAALFLGAALALAAVASLPGIDRQEGRWMIPVLACAGLLACAWARSWLRFALLGLLLACNGLYFWSGSGQVIYNIMASNLAEELADSLDSLVPGRRGVVLNVPKQDYGWPIAGNTFAGNAGTSGEMFCALNIASHACIDPPFEVNLRNHRQYDFGLYFIREEGGRREYRILSQQQVTALVEPNGISPSDLEMIGHGDAWASWRWNTPPPAGDGGIVVAPGATGTIDIPARNLAGRLLVYRARAVDPAGTVSMRLQVNWADATGGYMDGDLIVADVGATFGNYVMFVSPPAGAATGQVYATLHDGATGAVVLESIGILAF